MAREQRRMQLFERRAVSSARSRSFCCVCAWARLRLSGLRRHCGGRTKASPGGADPSTSFRVTPFPPFWEATSPALRWLQWRFVAQTLTQSPPFCDPGRPGCGKRHAFLMRRWMDSRTFLPWPPGSSGFVYLFFLLLLNRLYFRTVLGS